MADHQAHSALMSLRAMAMRSVADSMRGWGERVLPRAATKLRRCVEATRARAASSPRDSAAAEAEMLAVADEILTLAAEIRAYCEESSAGNPAQFEALAQQPATFNAKLASFSVKLRPLVPMMDHSLAVDLVSMIDILSEFQGSGLEWVLSQMRRQA